MEKISIIIPVYNTEKYLSKCLDSIIFQTYNNLEIILVDDGSPDNCGNICDEYAKKDERVKVIHRKNGGVSSARNEGLRNATGEYISFIDSDDWIELDMYESMIKKIKEKNVDAVRCSYTREYKEKQEIVEHLYKEDIIIDLVIDRVKFLESLISGKIHAYLPLLLIKKGSIPKNLRFNTSVAMREDLIWLVELSCIWNSIYIYNKEFYHYYQNTTSATNNEDFKIRNMKNMLLVSKEIESILKKYEFLTLALKEMIAFNFFIRISSELFEVVNIKRDKVFLKNFIEEKDYKAILENVNKKNLSILRRIFFYLCQIKNINLIFYYCLIREKIRIGKLIKGD